MKSMTGYGYGIYKSEAYILEIEIKSYNNRYLDISHNINYLLSSYESYVDEKIDQPALDANTVKQAQLTKKEELSDVAQILASVGLLGNTQGTKTTVIIQEGKDGTES